MKSAAKRTASEALAQMLAVTAMLVIAGFVFYSRWIICRLSTSNYSFSKRGDAR